MKFIMGMGEQPKVAEVYIVVPPIFRIFVLMNRSFWTSIQLLRNNMKSIRKEWTAILTDNETDNLLSGYIRIINYPDPDIREHPYRSQILTSHNWSDPTVIEIPYCLKEQMSNGSTQVSVLNLTDAGIITCWGPESVRVRTDTVGHKLMWKTEWLERRWCIGKLSVRYRQGKYTVTKQSMIQLMEAGSSRFSMFSIMLSYTSWIFKIIHDVYACCIVYTCQPYWLVAFLLTSVLGVLNTILCTAFAPQ